MDQPKRYIRLQTKYGLAASHALPNFARRKARRISPKAGSTLLNFARRTDTPPLGVSVSVCVVSPRSDFCPVSPPIPPTGQLRWGHSPPRSLTPWSKHLLRPFPLRWRGLKFDSLDTREPIPPSSSLRYFGALRARNGVLLRDNVRGDVQQWGKKRLPGRALAGSAELIRRRSVAAGCG